jgi:hypothetical protein
MRYWWVNQNQTYRAEVRGSFMWSPKQNANGARNQFYENMREVLPGDVVFSFCDTRIKAIGVVTGGAQTGPKPDFGAAGSKLSPHIDHLFDEGYITFSSGQELVIVSEVREKLLDAGVSTPACALASSPGTSSSRIVLSRSASRLKYRQDLPILCFHSLDSSAYCTLPSATT